MHYVIAQFACIIFLILNADFTNFSVLSICLLLLGIIIGCFAIYVMKFNNLSIKPELKDNHQLRIQGIYNTIAHPMYSSVLLQTLALLITSPTPINILIYFVLWIILFLKSKKEESYLMNKFSQYADYRTGVGRFLPKIF